jgi:hypothetical protein
MQNMCLSPRFYTHHMIIKEMFYIPIKLKHELARASMTTSNVNNQWRSNFQQQIIITNKISIHLKFILADNVHYCTKAVEYYPGYIMFTMKGKFSCQAICQVLLILCFKLYQVCNNRRRMYHLMQYMYIMEHEVS